jgi:hypothetical protein
VIVRGVGNVVLEVRAVGNVVVEADAGTRDGHLFRTAPSGTAVLDRDVRFRTVRPEEPRIVRY